MVDGPCVLKILRYKKDLLNHAFAQDLFLVSVGVEQKHRGSIRVNHPASRVDVIDQHTAGQGFGFAVGGAAVQLPRLRDEVGAFGFHGGQLLRADEIAPDLHLFHVHLASLEAAGRGQFASGVNRGKEVEALNDRRLQIVAVDPFMLRADKAVRAPRNHSITLARWIF